VKKTHESKRNQKILTKKIEKKKAKQQKKIKKQKKIEEHETQQTEKTQNTQKIEKIENQKQKENTVFLFEKRKHEDEDFDELKRRKIHRESFVNESNEKSISAYEIDEDSDIVENENVINDSDYIDIDFDVITDFEDEQKDVTVLKIIIVKLLKAQYEKLSRAEQKQFSQKKMNLRRLLKLSFTKVYTKKNLKNSKTLDRALRLLFVARFDQVNQHIRINSHVEYDRLLRLILNIIQTKMKKKNAQLQKCLDIFNDSRFISFRFHI
jgi:hypothetical protein